MRYQRGGPLGQRHIDVAANQQYMGVKPLDERIGHIGEPFSDLVAW